ncbi:MAG TPA: hypothetical protein VI357_03975 [Mycobacteriales bacterium]
MVLLASVLIVAAAVVVCWSRADIGAGGRRAAVARFARRSGLPPSSVDDEAERRVVRRDRVALAGVILALPAGQHLLDQGLVFSSIAVGYVGLALAALVGHLTSRPAPDGPRVAHATSRGVAAYVPPWLVGTAVAGAAMTVALLVAWALTPRVDAPIFPTDAGAVPTVLLGAAVVGALAVSLWAARVVAGGRQVAGTAEQLAVDDALRAQTVRDCLHLTAATTIVALGTVDTWFGWADDPFLQEWSRRVELLPLLLLAALALAVRTSGARRWWRDRLHEPVPA